MGKGAAGGIGDIFGGLGGGAGDVSGAGGDLLGGLGGGDPFGGMGGGLGGLGGGFGDMFGSGMGDMSLFGGGGSLGGLDSGNLTGAPSAANLGGQNLGQGLFNQAQGSPVTQGGQTFAGEGSQAPAQTNIGDDLKQVLGVPPQGPTGLAGAPAPNTPGSAQLQSIPVQTQSFVNDPSGVDNPDSPYNQALRAQSTGSFASGTSPVPFGGQAQTASVPGSIAAQPYSTAASFPTEQGGSLTQATTGFPAPQPVSTAAAAPSASPAADAAASAPAAATNAAAANVTASQAATNGITQGLSQAGLPQQVIQMLGSLFSGLGGHNNPMQALTQMMGILGGRGAHGSPQSQAGIAQVLNQLSRMGMPQQVVAMIGDLLSALASHGNPTQLLQQLMQMLQGQGGTQNAVTPAGGGNGGGSSPILQGAPNDIYQQGRGA